jgi:hypothetical protein
MKAGIFIYPPKLRRSEGGSSFPYQSYEGAKADHRSHAKAPKSEGGSSEGEISDKR